MIGTFDGAKPEFLRRAAREERAPDERVVLGKMAPKAAERQVEQARHDRIRMAGRHAFLPIFGSSPARMRRMLAACR